MPIYIFIYSSGDIFCLAVAILYVTMLAANRWQLSYKYGPDWAYFYLKNIEFVLLLDFILLFFWN